MQRDGLGRGLSDYINRIGCNGCSIFIIDKDNFLARSVKMGGHLYLHIIGCRLTSNHCRDIGGKYNRVNNI